MLLCSLELAAVSPAVARLAANRFLTGCILRYLIEGVLVAKFNHLTKAETSIVNWHFDRQGYRKSLSLQHH